MRDWLGSLLMAPFIIGPIVELGLYLVPKCMTLGRFPNGGESDSTRRTEEVRHVGSDTFAPGF